MSLSTSLTNSSQQYPSTSSDYQWNPELNVPQNQQEYLVDEQYIVNPVCIDSSATYNHPKITNGTHCINSQMNFNPPNCVNLYNPNGLNGQDIRFQNAYTINNPGVVFNGPRNGHFVPNVSTSWASPLRRERIVTRPAWGNQKPTTSGGVKKSKRIRTAFTSHQMMELENEYARARYLDRSRRIELSEVLKLNERTIKIWFQNRRMKEKKDKSEANEEAEASSTTESSPDLGGPMIMYDPYPNNGLYDRNIYVEQYPVVSTMAQHNVNSCLVDNVVNTVPNCYSTFVVENNMQVSDYEMQCRQINMQLENYSISVKKEGEECTQATQEETSTSENSNIEASKNSNDVNEENWDLSWIRSIQIDEDV